MKTLQRIKTYIIRNYSAQVIVINVIAVVLVVALLQFYMEAAFRPTLSRQLENQKSSILRQESTIIETQMEYFLQLGSGFATDDALYYQAEQTAAETVYGGQHLALANMLTQLASYSNDIVELAVIRDGRILAQFDKSHYKSNYGIWGTATLDTATAMAEEVIESSNNKSVPKYVWGTVPDQYGVNQENVIHLALPIIGDRHSYAGFSNVLIATFRLTGLREFLSSSDEYSGFNGIYITNADGEIAYAYYRDMTGQDSAEYLAASSMDVLTHELGASGLSLNIAVDPDVLGEPVNELFYMGFRLYVFLLAVLAAGYCLLTSRMLRPIQVIRQAMEQIEDGAPASRITVRGQYEIEQLAEQYNQMADSLTSQIALTAQENQEKLVQMQRATNAEKEALESQINAHFLCNMLNAIHYDAIDHGEEQISRLLVKLSNILRYSFSHQYDHVSIAQEMAWVDQYLYLQQFRLLDAFRYEIHYPSEYDAWPCTKLILQPFVENSILHGFEGRESGGEITIIGEVQELRPDSDVLQRRGNCGNAAAGQDVAQEVRNAGQLQDARSGDDALGQNTTQEAGQEPCMEPNTDEYMVIRIKDNGKGMPKDKAAEIQRILDNTETKEMQIRHGIGIRNVCARLRMFYGDQFRITMATIEGLGTEFTLYLPIPPSMREDA